MKKINILLWSLWGLGLRVKYFRSNDQEDASSDNYMSITGQWEWFNEGNIVDGKEYLEDYHHETECSIDYVEFLSDGTFKLYYSNKDESGKCITIRQAGKYTIEASILAIKVNQGEVTKYEILTLDAQILKIKRTYLIENISHAEISIFKKNLIPQTYI